MSGKPKVSVCIPVYNGLPWIEQTIQSVLAQSLQNFEIVARDDCSRDGTDEFLRKLADGDRRVRVFRNSRNIDVGGQYNLLFEDAVGDFILKLDADDLLAPTFLERAVRAADTHAADVVMAGWEWLDVASEAWRRPPAQRFLREGLVADPLRLVLEKNPFSMCFGIFRRGLLDRIRRDDQFVLFTETCDCECQIRLANAGARFYFIDEILGQYRIHDANRSSRPNVQAESQLCDVLPYWHDAIAEKLGRRCLRAHALRILRDHIKGVVRGRTPLSGKIALGATRLIAGQVVHPSWCLCPEVLQNERTQTSGGRGCAKHLSNWALAPSSTSMPPLVSILIPTYCRPVLLRGAVKSALAQTYPAIEVVVGDDSPDGASRAAIADLIDTGRVRYVRHAPPHGQACNVNRLFRLAAGELLVLLHDDDLLLPNAVASLAKLLEDPTVVAAFGKQYLIDRSGRVDEASSEHLNAAYHRTPAQAGRQSSPLRSALTAQFPNDGFMVRTNAAQRVGYRDDPRVGDACDLDFGIRLAADGGAFFFLDQYTAKYRTTGISVLRRADSDAAISAYNLIAEVRLPPELEPLRYDRLACYGPMVVSGLLARGDKQSAWRVYTSATYSWRRRLSLRGLRQVALLALPLGLVQAVLAARRRLRFT